MATHPCEPPVRKPSLVVSIVIFVCSVGLMAWLRLLLYRETMITLTYGLPLLLCLWHRDRRLLWAMTVTFAGMSAFKAFYLILPDAPPMALMHWIMQLINTLAIASAIQFAMVLMDRLQDQNKELLKTNEELAAREEEINRQNEELQVQSEELAQQNEELQQQSEELQQQSEELQARSDELLSANSELKKREIILQRLLESLRVQETDRAVLDSLCQSALDLIGGGAVAAAVVERSGDELVLLASTPGLRQETGSFPFKDSFTEIIIQENRTAFIEDLRDRPDIGGLTGERMEFRSVLSAPLRTGSEPIGAVKIYSASPQRWTTEHFRIIEWVAVQSSLILEVRRLRNALARSNTDLERLVQERTMRLQELVDELEHFSYSITHDMRAPLRAMQGFAEMLAMEGNGALSAAERQDYLERIITAAGRMDRLITDALSYSRSVRLEMVLDVVDPRRLLKGMIESYPEFQLPRARIELAEELPSVLANEAGLTQCFSNLLNNAVKFVEQNQQPHVQVRAEMIDGRVRIWFEDNGIGIPQELAPRMFRMFQRGSRKYEGTGIGLALVRKVTERMGGRVGVESRPGKGSRFWLELRAANGGSGNG